MIRKFASPAARGLAGILAIAGGFACATAGRAGAMPRTIGVFSLGISRDSLANAAAAGNYRQDRNLGGQVGFSPPIRGDALFTATLQREAVVRLQFSWIGVPTREDFDAVVGEYIAQLGAPSDSSERDSVLQVRWMDDSTLATVRASIGSRRVALQGNLYHRPAFEAAGALNPAVEKPAVPARKKLPRRKPIKPTPTATGKP